MIMERDDTSLNELYKIFTHLVGSDKRSFGRNELVAIIQRHKSDPYKDNLKILADFTSAGLIKRTFFVRYKITRLGHKFWIELNYKFENKPPLKIAAGQWVEGVFSLEANSHRTVVILN